MKADMIIKNAKIFTSDKEMPQATSLAVKDGKFIYVGDEAGLADYEGEVIRTRLQGATDEELELLKSTTVFFSVPGRPSTWCS